MRNAQTMECLPRTEQVCSTVKIKTVETAKVTVDNQEEIITGIENTQCYQKYGSACVGAGYETREEAREYGMSFGKYKAYQELLKYYPDITPEECNELSMNEIKNLILENGGEWIGNSQNNSRCTNSTDETKGQNSGNSGKGENSGNGKGNGNKGGNQKGKN
ncbi:hypothetical protein [Anaeromassilibacillus sp. An172]|uniref:hypothetical protein n=1 Tax=Anaeromassilibacillus sp. An172 TaxID=1965570 RepID=UPI003FA42DAC